MPQRFIVLDLETRGVAPETLAEVMPAFKAAANLKDPEKIKADIADKEKAWLGESALHAERGEILCAGILDSDTPISWFIDGYEKDIVEAVMVQLLTSWSNATIVGHNIFHFDLPYLVRRALKYGITIPGFLRKALRSYYPPDQIFDTMLEWRLSNREERISLDMLAWHLGVGRKNGSGKDFAALYASDRPKALEYLRNDLELTKRCFERMNPAPIAREVEVVP